MRFFLSFISRAAFPGSPPSKKASRTHAKKIGTELAMREVGPLHCAAASEAAIIAVVSLRGSEGSNFVAGVMSCCGFFHSGPPFPSVESEKHSFLVLTHTHTHTPSYPGEKGKAKRPRRFAKGKISTVGTEGRDGTSKDANAIVPIGATSVVNFILNEL